jgi:ribosomal protein S18 acetylase RimI-like enzyme
MKVRQATLKDYEAIVKFQLEMAKETEGIDLLLEPLEKGVKALLENPSKGVYYVTVINKKVVSSLLTTYEWSDWRNGTVLWIQSVYVMPQYRRRGVYRNMYSHIKSMVLSSDNLMGIRLYADKSNLAAHKTYENLGMNQDHYITFEWLK